MAHRQRKDLALRREARAQRRAAAAQAGTTPANWQRRLQAARRQWRDQVAAFRAGLPAPPCTYSADDWPIPPAPAQGKRHTRTCSTCHKPVNPRTAILITRGSPDGSSISASSYCSEACARPK